MDWFLNDIGLRHERVKHRLNEENTEYIFLEAKGS